ncbi:MAG: hypothetical protein NVS2B3_05330 [Vulcanimicrobiaceae bacterium]
MITSLLILLIVVLGIYISSHNLSVPQILLASTLLVGGVILIVSPDLSVYAARALNVGRGSDLVIYLSLVFGLFVSANFYFRFKKAEQQMITLVRELALVRGSMQTPSLIHKT